MKVSLLQVGPYQDDQEANQVRGECACRQAKASGADIALFPEMWNIGYAPFLDKTLLFQLHSGALSREAVFKKLMSQAIEQDSAFVKHFQSLAQELEMAIVITYLENHQGNLRNTASLIDRHGKMVLTYAKIHTVDHQLEKLCTSGDDFYVGDLDTASGPVKIGIMICFDTNFPESARILMLKGAEIILIPSADRQDDNRIEQLKTRAFENMLGVAMACYPDPLRKGHSCATDGIVRDQNGGDLDPLLVEAGHQEGLFLADFDLSKLRAYRERDNFGGKHRKPQYYHALIKQPE